MGEEDFSTAPNDRLTFSIDTLALDTVIAGEATSTYTFQVFNKNDKALRISHIRLGQEALSPFNVNVDGTWLEGGVAPFEFNVSGHDSMRVFVHLRAHETDTDLPQAVEDFLEFHLESGTTQKVVLTAASQDVKTLKGLAISESTTLASPRPYRILDSLVVAPGTTLTIGAGTQLLFHSDASLIVHGTLRVEGTSDNPVTFRGDRLGNMFQHQPYDRIPGQWGGITFTRESTDNDLTWCDIHSGTYGIQCDSTGTDTQKLIIDNSIIHNTTHDALAAKDCKIYVGNCQITNAGGDCVSLVGGNYTFVHCTIGQFYSFLGGHGVALRFANSYNNEPIPLTGCTFVNCLITGYSDDDIMGEASERYTDCPFVYAFKNCLLNTPLIEGVESIENCLFEDKKDYDYKAEGDSTTIKAGNFSPAFDLDQLIFPFTLSPRSRAVNAADASLTRQSGYDKDLRGRSRFDDNMPDIGAYEAIIENKE